MYIYIYTYYILPFSLINNVYAFEQTITTICTDLSDCPKLVRMVLKTTVPRSQSKEISYVSNSSKCKNELKNVLTNNDTCIKFDGRYLKVLNSYARLKRNY